MRAIDHYAWTNRWRNRHPVEKLLPAFSLLLLTLLLPPLTTGPLVVLLTALATVRGAGVPVQAFWTVMAVPAAFLLVGAPLMFWLALSMVRVWVAQPLVPAIPASSIRISSPGCRFW